MKDLCAISCGRILMTVVGGVYLHVEQAILLDRI